MADPTVKNSPQVYARISGVRSFDLHDSIIGGRIYHSDALRSLLVEKIFPVTLFMVQSQSMPLYDHIFEM